MQHCGLASGDRSVAGFPRLIPIPESAALSPGYSIRAMLRRGDLAWQRGSVSLSSPALSVASVGDLQVNTVGR